MVTMTFALVLLCLLVTAVVVVSSRPPVDRAAPLTPSPEVVEFLAHIDQPLWAESQRIEREYYDMMRQQDQARIDKAWGGMPPSQRATGPNGYLDVSPWGGNDLEQL